MKHKFLLFSIYLFACLLISEWVYPFVSLTEICSNWWMISFIGISLACFFFHLRYYIILPLHVFLIYVFMGVYFYNGHPFATSWFPSFFTLLQKGIAQLLARNVYHMGIGFIVFIFFIALWLLTYIIAYCILRKQRLMSILILTLLYVTVINLFTPYHDGTAFIRVVVIGFILLHLTLAYRLESQVTKQAYLYHSATFILLIVCILFASLLPRSAPRFNDPTPYLRDILGINTIQQVGYSEDDTKLGGALANDETEVFHVKTRCPHYYRVEAKQTYTGKGWADAQDTKKKYFETNSEFPVQLNDDSQREATIVKVAFTAPNDFLIYPYGTAKIVAAQQTLTFLPNLEKITPKDTIKNYTAIVNEPVYDVAKMKKADYENVSAAFLEQYTQLPENLPKRIKKLAKKITAKAKDPFEQSKVIESYLNSEGGFTYSTKKAKATPFNADYVDEFLFTTKIGYCDNFSSAMVVMLRTLGIPARWAKGFNAGKALFRQNDLVTYSIKNDNAHSWPEVYFPGTGWVPFEPTASFHNPEEFIDLQAGMPAKESNPPAKKSESTTKKNINQTKKEASKSQVAKHAEVKSAKKTKQPTHRKQYSSFWLWLSIGLVFLIIMMLIFYKRIMITLLIWQIRNRKIAFKTAYQKLLRILERHKKIRQDSNTLRSFAEEVDSAFATAEMRMLTQAYEEWLYGEKEINLLDYQKAFLTLLNHLRKL